MNKLRIIEKIIKEPIVEDEDQEEGVVLIDRQNNIVNLGLSIDQEGFNTPKCGKQKNKRQRKSHKELRSVDGQVKEQKKIFKVLNIGKKKNLPSEH